MKYLKTYENLNKPEVGDWVYAIEDESVGDNIIEYIKTHIGILTTNEDDYHRYDYDSKRYWVSYSYYPDDDRPKAIDLWWFYKNQIKFWSKDKEEVEAYMVAQKYNL